MGLHVGVHGGQLCESASPEWVLRSRLNKVRKHTTWAFPKNMLEHTRLQWVPSTEGIPATLFARCGNGPRRRQGFSMYVVFPFI